MNISPWSFSIIINSSSNVAQVYPNQHRRDSLFYRSRNDICYQNGGSSGSDWIYYHLFPSLFRVNIKFPVIERPSLPVAGEISSFRIYIYKAHRIKLIEAWNCFQFDCATGGTSNYRHRIAMCRLVEFTARKVALPFICNLFPLWYRAVTKLDSLYGIFFFSFFFSSSSSSSPPPRCKSVSRNILINR